jgi:hypothetical protein
LSTKKSIKRFSSEILDGCQSRKKNLKKKFNPDKIAIPTKITLPKELPGPRI